MTLLVEKGTFTKTTSTATPVAQTITLSNSSLTPKFVILWTNEVTANATFSENHYFAFGYSDGTTHASQIVACEDNDTALVAGYSFNNDCVLSLHNDATPLATSQVSRCTVTSFAAGQVNLSWSVQTDTSAKIIHYIVGGGTDITNVKVLNSTKQNTSTGSHSWTGAGFQPDFVLAMTGCEGYTTANSIGTASTVGGGITIGAAASSTQEFVMSSRSEFGAGTSDTDMNLHDNATLLTLSPTDGTETYLADFTSFDSDGLTLNVSNGATSGSELVSFLCIKGGKWDVGAFQARSGTGTQDISLEEHSDPELVFLAGINSATLNGTVANNYVCVGASDGTNEGCVWAGDQNGAATMVSTRISLVTKVFRQSVPNATASSSTTTCEDDMTGMSTTGKFTLDQTTSGTQVRIGFWSLGVSGTANFVRSPSSDSVTISETLSRARTAAAGSPQNVKVGIITKDSTSGAHTQNFTNEAGFAPQWGIFILSGKTASGTGAHIQNSVGFTDGTNHYCIIRRNINGNNSAGSNTISFRPTDNYTMGLDDTVSSSTTITEGTVIFGSNGWDISWGKATTTQNKIIYIVGGGGGFHDAKVTTHTHGSSPFQHTNVGFEGDIVFFLHAPAGTIDTLTATCNIDFGVAMSSSARWASCFGTNSGFNTVGGRRQRADRCWCGISNGNADRGVADFDGMLSNGFDIGTPSGGNATDSFGSLVINGGLWDVGSFNQATSNGTQQVNITTGRTPTAVILSTVGAATTTSISTDARLSIGAFDSDTEASIWDGFQSGSSTSYINGSDFSDTKVIRTLDETSGSGTLQTEADFSSFQSGSFTINNTTTDATSREICYVAFTPEASGTNYERSPSAETVDIADSSITRILTANRTPSSDSITVTDSSLTRVLSAIRSPSSDSVTTSEDVQRSKTWPRQPSDETVTVTDVSTTQMITRVRAPDAETVTLGENLSRMTQAFRSPSSDTVDINENLSGGKLLERAPSAENVTVADSSVTRLLSASRSPSADDITIGENLTRILSAMRSPTSDSVSVTDVSTTQMITRVRSTEDTVSVTDASLTRILSATRTPSSDSVTVTDNSLTRILSALRVPSTETVDITEDVDAILTNPGQFNRSPATENVTVSENLSRTLQLFRAPSSDTVSINENVTGGKLLERIVAADTVNIVEASLTRIKSASRSVEDTSNVNEASLTRLLTAIRIPSPDSVTVSELQNAISHSRVLQDTVSITEPLLQRVVTHIRSLGPEFVDISEQVFFQTYHKFVFDSVIVADQVFAQRQSLSGPTTYATPSEVRPLLGNIGSQRLDAQIQLAIDSAYDEINKKTMRIPPNDWKDTDADFSIIKKITRMKAALEMSIGIKDFEDREWMQKEIEEMFAMLEEHDIGGAQSNDVVISSEDETYSLNPQGIIWSQRYKNLRKQSSNENDTTINPDT